MTRFSRLSLAAVLLSGFALPAFAQLQSGDKATVTAPQASTTLTPQTQVPAQKRATDKLATDKLATDKLATDKLATDKVGTDRLDKKAEAVPTKSALHAPSDKLASKPVIARPKTADQVSLRHDGATHATQAVVRQPQPVPGTVETSSH